MPRIRYPIAIIATFNGLFVLCVLFQPGGHATTDLVDDLANVLGPLLALPLCFSRLGLLRRQSAPQWAAASLGLGILCFTVGEALWTYYDQVVHQPPFPSWADAAYLVAYPFLLLGIVLLPGRPLPFASRTRTLLDGLMVMTAVVTFSWYFVLGPTLFQSGNSLFAKSIGTAYPLGDLVLLASLLLLAIRVRAATLHRAVVSLSVGLGIIVFTDSAFDYQSLHATYVNGTLLDVGWSLGYMIVGLGAFCLRHGVEPAHEDMPDAAPPQLGQLWTSFLPYPLVPAVVALAAFVAYGGNDARLEPGVLIGGAALTILVLIRQILTLLQNLQLAQDLFEKNRRLAALAATDPITNLPNHRAVAALLDRELDRATRRCHTVAVLLIDIDHFKALNDSRGHPAGDAALHEFGATIQRSLRSSDILGRWGGEEFVLILPEVDAEEACLIGERIRSTVARHAFRVGGGMQLTCSLGIALYPHHGETQDTLIELADQAMYRAKHAGRNQVCVHQEARTETVIHTVSARQGHDPAQLLPQGATTIAGADAGTY